MTLQAHDLTPEERDLLDRIVMPWLVPHESRREADIKALYTYALLVLGIRREVLQAPIPKPLERCEEDLIVWPDGSWCYLHERSDYSWKSDDYEHVQYGTGVWQALVDGETSAPALEAPPTPPQLDPNWDWTESGGKDWHVPDKVEWIRWRGDRRYLPDLLGDPATPQEAQPRAWTDYQIRLAWPSQPEMTPPWRSCSLESYIKARYANGVETRIVEVSDSEVDDYSI